jgi:hypothetical protein
VPVPTALVVYRVPMQTAIGSLVLWLQRIAAILAVALTLVAAVALAAWLVVVDWQVIVG